MRKVEALSESENDKAICTWYFVLAAHKLGDVAEAQEKLAAARRQFPSCVVGPRIEREIAKAVASRKVERSASAQTARD